MSTTGAGRWMVIEPIPDFDKPWVALKGRTCAELAWRYLKRHEAEDLAEILGLD